MKRSEIKKMVSQYAAAKHRHEKAPSARLAGIMSDIEHRYYHETGETIGGARKD